MKKLNIKLLSLLLALSFGIKVQNIDAKSLKEKLLIYSDRTLYIAGEQILFSTIILDENNSNNNSSKIFYAELVTADGYALTNGKFTVKNNLGSGNIDIPDEIASGVYYLRSYTKNMRNYGPQSYSYIPLKIINPVTSDVYPKNDDKNSSELFQFGEQRLDTTDIYSLLLDKKEYIARERVKFEMQRNNIGERSLKNACISVVPEQSLIENNLLFSADFNAQTLKENHNIETEGVSLTGQIVNGELKKSFGSSTVNMSIIGDKDFVAVLTNPEGRFSFTLPHCKGSRDIFLSSDIVDSTELNILVDNDFCSHTVNLPSPILNLSEEEIKVAYNLAMNKQIKSHFNKEIISNQDSINKYETPFYGEPAKVLDIDRYVELTTLSEYFTELISFVKIRKRKGIRYFKVIGQEKILLINDPLVLIDYVAIDNPEKIMDIHPKYVSRIELINTDYVKGSITYGGIISIISKKNDFAGIDLPSSGIFIDYKFLTEASYNIQEEYHKHTPDVRNTVYWNPDVQLNTEDAVEFNFTTPDTPGKYVIVLRGIDNKGKTFNCSTAFVVK